MFYVNPYFISGLVNLTFIDFVQMFCMLYLCVFIVFGFEYYHEYKNPCVEDENGNMVIPSKSNEK